MKNITSFIILLTLCISSPACKSKKSASNLPENNLAVKEVKEYEEEVIATDEKPVLVEPEIELESVKIIKEEPKVISSEESKEELFSMVVSFFSRGAGIDFMVAREYESLVKKYETAHPEKFTAERVGWGREGELDYCIQFGDLNKNIAREFVNQSRVITDKTDLVHVKMDSECRRRRKK